MTDHYENFPVDSWFLPKQYRQALKTIYAFARTADDVADEPSLNLTKEQRLDLLNNYAENIIEPKNKFFIELNHIITQHNLSKNLFLDLLTAFKQDVHNPVYETEQDLLNYCKYSANPVGRLMLELIKQNSPENLLLSDKICTGLQLINFLQDWQQDLDLRQRCYFPLEHQAKFDLNLLDYANIPQDKLADFFNFETIFTKNIYNSGLALYNKIPGIMGFNLRLIIRSSSLVLKRLESRKNPFFRPKLYFYDWPILFIYAIF